ncbi:hypothetical protein AQUCO_01300759v1 [Aquilegia coerulea]|uniref:Protein kinase domain-containing protein n=1 Tax=Aquilegia coerulea TaxID=218851 RepID=A0A2G5E378_AQUCA|nr:hypothetical protein AQUCO_01300759v1 [Aquilegia coerulea]
MGLQKFSLTMIILLSCVLSTPVADQSQQCQRQCGDQIVPYPFGISGDSEECFRNSSYKLLCNDTHNPPKLFFSSLPILNISVENSTAIVQLPTAVTCYDESTRVSSHFKLEVDLGTDSPFTFSTYLNKFTAIGCSTYGLLKYGSTNIVGPFGTGCVIMCDNTTIIPSRSNITQLARPCAGKFVGCCQTDVPRGNNHISIDVEVNNRPTNRFASNPCDYGYLAVAPDFSLKMSPEKVIYSEVALDWAIGDNCENTTSGAGVSNPSNCGPNTSCANSKNGPGYLCHCNQGYQGNPYISCTDIDECENKHSCKQGSCKNTPGNYSCQCQFGYQGDGKVGCSISTASRIMISIGAIIFLLALVLFLRWRYKKKIQEINHQNNGGSLLENLSMKKFKEAQLEKATNNFDAQRLLGEGGNGWVYKGSIENMIDIAVKKSKVVDQNQIEQFLNEADVVSKINHKNVVKLLGVCCESKVPMLVYEFVPNGTLSHHIHASSSRILSSWRICLRIVADTARALDYMHSDANPPIIHRDVKPSNILLDGTYTAKVSDFGASKLFPRDRTIAPTQGQGTMGYLDPEYVQTCELTTMSDVYGFGIVLMELLTKQKPLTQTKPGEMISLVKVFTSAVENNQLDHVLKVPVAIEHETEDLHIVAKLAVRCVSMPSKDRPTMTEVADVLNGLSKKYCSSQVEGRGDERVSLVDDQDVTSASFELEYSSSV